METQPASIPADATALRKWRTDRGLSQAAFGKLVGLSKGRVCEIENNDPLRPCSIDKCLEIERTTGIVLPRLRELREGRAAPHDLGAAA